MASITLADIYNDGITDYRDTFKTVYLTPGSPNTYYKNMWVYHQMPTVAEWERDQQLQRRQHLSQGSDHLCFYFPENAILDDHWQAVIRNKKYQLGTLELYAVEPDQFLSENRCDTSIEITTVNTHNLNDYLEVFRQFSLPYGKEFTEESISEIRETYLLDEKERLVAYSNGTPIGILDLIFRDNTVEIDGFGVIESMRRRGIGTAMQRYVAKVARGRTMILVADGDDTAKDMYLKQGYIYISFCYQILKEHI
ncbi:GNAT family N-acetyltransferase [Staphylococcus sp. SQ8-PEA]|uniref:GNAT family N-acetyltransferase n=1 Tax=Staphylococcus marylandisciuri TaxID=2981529 RepID=A0ABT2QMJ0_9STAP|nr:GNAT family N-acetyltransferase [Staphylococcus marylandisciuri]MCU5745192.1 GNAT family N-acetyltransferase [Staphylococcus marylandisciuri]